MEMADDLSNGDLLKIFGDLVVIKDVLNAKERCNQCCKTWRYPFCVRKCKYGAELKEREKLRN